MIVNTYRKASNLKDIPDNYDEWMASITQNNAPRLKGRVGCLTSYTDASPNRRHVIGIDIYIYICYPPLKPTFYRKTMACALENPFQAAFPGKYTFHNKYVTNTRDIPLL